MSFVEKEQDRKKLKPEKLPIVWVINTAPNGELNTRKGIAEKINSEYEIHDFLDIAKSVLDIPTIKKPDIVVGTGRLINLQEYMAERLKNVLFISNNRYGVDLNYGDSRDCTNLSKFISTIGSPHAVTTEKIEAGKKEWGNEFSGMNEPKVAVLLGGSCKWFDFTPELARKMAKELAEKVKELGGSLIVTTSRRTGKEATEAFMDEINAAQVPTYLHDWRFDNAKGNPYYGILGLADAIIVGGDSASMCSEANMSKKPVYIYAPDGTREIDNKLHEQLYSYKLKDGVPNPLAKPFSEFIAKGIEPWDYEPLDTASDIAKEALKRWQEKQKSMSK